MIRVSSYGGDEYHSAMHFMMKRLHWRRYWVDLKRQRKPFGYERVGYSDDKYLSIVAFPTIFFEEVNPNCGEVKEHDRWYNYRFKRRFYTAKKAEEILRRLGV